MDKDNPSSHGSSGQNLRILVFGTFDGIHKGHEALFKQARKYGDYLTVVVARDSTVQKVKNHLPKYNENERLKALKKCDLVDEARLGNEGDPYKIIKEIKPDIICLGYDQNSFTEKLEEKLKEMGLNVEIKKLKAHKPKIYHSSILNKT